MKNNDKGLNLKIPTELYNSLQKAADRKYISLASAVRIACAEWVERNADTGPDSNKAASAAATLQHDQYESNAAAVFARLPHTAVNEGGVSGGRSYSR